MKVTEALIGRQSLRNISAERVSYMEAESEGIGMTLVEIPDWYDVSPVFAAPADFRGDRQNTYRSSSAHGHRLLFIFSWQNFDSRSHSPLCF